MIAVCDRRTHAVLYLHTGEEVLTLPEARTRLLAARTTHDEYAAIMTLHAVTGRRFSR